MNAPQTFELPSNPFTSPGVRGGRVPLDGYRRGWGLQFGSLAEEITKEPLFVNSSERAGIPTWVGGPKRHNLYLLMTRFLPKLETRNIVEFGAYRGGNVLFMALVMREIDPAAKVFALDTFEGMPPTDKTIDAHDAGHFADAEFGTLQRRIADLHLTNLILVKGLFQDTFPEISKFNSFGLAHIDCDIYSAVKYSQDAVWPTMCPGGYVAYDDADVSSCLGATQAVEELIMERRIHSEQIWPHFVFRANMPAT